MLNKFHFNYLLPIIGFKNPDKDTFVKDLVRGTVVIVVQDEYAAVSLFKDLKLEQLEIAKDIAQVLEIFKGFDEHYSVFSWYKPFTQWFK